MEQQKGNTKYMMSTAISVLIDVIYHPAVKKIKPSPKMDFPVNAYAEIFYKSGLRKSNLYPQKSVIRKVKILTMRLRTG